MRANSVYAAIFMGLISTVTSVFGGEPEPVQTAVPATGGRCFAVFLAHQSSDNAIKFSHTYAVFVRAGVDGRRIEESHTISWFPVSEIVSLARPAEPGINLTLEQSLTWAEERKLEVSVLGPYEINAELFARASAQAARLARGELRYKAFDRLSRDTAKNCIHALADIFEDEGRLNSGTTRGRDATELVVKHFTRHIVSANVEVEANELLAALNLQRYRQPPTSDLAAK